MYCNIAMMIMHVFQDVSKSFVFHLWIDMILEYVLNFLKHKKQLKTIQFYRSPLIWPVGDHIRRKILDRRKMCLPVLHRVRTVKQLTQHVVRGNFWVPTNGRPPCWWWGYQSAICIHDCFEMGCHFSPSLIQSS